MRDFIFMKKIAKFIGQTLTGISAVVVLYTSKVMALTVQEGAAAARAEGMPAELIGPTGVFTRITNTILYVIGIVSVIMLIFGGFRYVISAGDSKNHRRQKHYSHAIIGLIIALLSYAIVHFVISTIGALDA